MEVFPDFGVGGWWYFTGILEFLLQLLHAVKLTVDVVRVVGYLVDERDNLTFLLEIGLTVGLLSCVVLGAAFLEDVEQLLQVVLVGILFGGEVGLVVAVGQEGFFLLGHFLAPKGKECRFDGLYLFLDLLDGAGCCLLHEVHQLCFALAGKVKFGGWFLVGSGRFLFRSGGFLFGSSRLFFGSSRLFLGSGWLFRSSGLFRCFGRYSCLRCLGFLSEYGFFHFFFISHNFLGLVLGLSAQDLIFLEIVHRFRLFTRFHHNNSVLFKHLSGARGSFQTPNLGIFSHPQSHLVSFFCFLPFFCKKKRTYR